MNLLSNLQSSFHHIFELYKTQGKRWYGFSMLFAVITSLVSALLACIVLIIYYFATEMALGDGMSSFMHIIDSSDFLVDFAIYSQLFTLMNMSLYGLFLRKHESNPEKVTLGAFFRSISGSTWGMYFLLSAGGILVSKIITDLITPHHYGPSSIEQLTSLFGEYGFFGWLMSIIRLAVSILPVLLAFLLIRRTLSREGLQLNRAEAKTTFLALLILSFVMLSFSEDVIYFVQKYIMSLIGMPFVDAWIPGLLMLVIYMVLIGILYPGIAGAMIYPFLHRNEKTLTDENLIDQ